MTAPSHLPDPTFAMLDAAAAEASLQAIGGLYATAEDDLPAGAGTIVLLAPREPGFWARVTAEPEFADGRPDPLDRWSRRAVGGLASRLGATPLFPFSGPPWRPFLDWARRSGRLHVSPVGLLVHHEAGLFVSLRGALALPGRMDLPAATAAPCATCAGQPCRTACPVGALGGESYDIDACRGHLAVPAGLDCLDAGCRARRSCPISAGYPREAEQSAFHMRAFTGATRRAP